MSTPTNLRDLALPDIVTVGALARILRLKPAAVCRMFRKGLIPGRKLGRQWVVPRSLLLAHLEPGSGAAAGPALRLVREEGDGAL